MITVKLQVLPHGEGLPLPAYQTDGAAGMDLFAALDADLVLESLDRAAVPTGIAVQIPPGYEGQVRARSGRALREGLAMVNAPGTVDSDYRGELRVIVVNLGRAPITLRRGERVAQLVFCPVARATLDVVTSLAESARGGGGFGSTGV